MAADKAAGSPRPAESGQDGGSAGQGGAAGQGGGAAWRRGAAGGQRGGAAGQALGGQRAWAAGQSVGRQPGAVGGDPWGAARYREESVRLVLWRHGQTRWNVEGRFQGQTDIPLDEVGEQQAERAARLLAALRPDAIYASDLSRAMGTAAPLARLTGLTVAPDKDLRERSGGLWEGMTDAEIRVQYPAEHAQWTPPGGETSEMVAERAGGAMERIAGKLPAGSLVVVVSHGAALRLGAARLLGFPAELWGAVGPLANCSWSVVGRRSSRWRLLEHNAGTLPEPVLSDDR